MREWFRQSEGNAAGLVIVAGALMTVGVVMRASTSASLDESFAKQMAWNGPVVKQAAFAAMGFLVMLACSRFDVGLLRWRRGSVFQPTVLIAVVAVALLLCVWVPGVGRLSHGRTRWLVLGPIGFQPSELAKIAMIGLVAALLTRPQRDGSDRAPGLMIPMMGVGIFCCLVGVEDFGTAALLAMVGGFMLVVGGCSWKAMLSWVTPAVAVFGYMLLAHPYRFKRLATFVDIWAEPNDGGYHAIQSLAAIASGGWTGRGLGTGLAKYAYLPESSTDFVFAVICEETGVIGGAMVIALFVVFVVLGLRTMVACRSDDGGFTKLFVFGVTAAIGLQAMMNVAVVTVVAPTKGISLPFVSAGGSGTVCFAMAVGLLAGAARSRRIMQSAGLRSYEPFVRSGGHLLEQA
jgi:cell division protein FtsW